MQDSGNSCNSQTKLPEFFPVRRSVRKTEKTVLEEKRKTLEEAVLSNKEDGLEVPTLIFFLPAVTNQLLMVKNPV